MEDWLAEESNQDEDVKMEVEEIMEIEPEEETDN
jgi:hypothetical protein